MSGEQTSGSKHKKNIVNGIHVVAKPIGSLCNLNCEYCFYLESKMVSLWAGYRALGVDYRDGSGSHKFVYDVTFQGPALGIGFRF